MDPDASKDVEMADATAIAAPPHQDEQQSATTQALSNSPSESQMEPTLAEPEAPVSNNAPGFKYKYSQASPTPPGVDDTDWNKIYTAADSRMYNKHGKNANNSKKFRESGETRVLALSMLKEKMEKLKKEKEGGTLPTPKPKAPAPKKAAPVKKESSTGSRDATPGGDIMPMSISEKIKSEGRARKASSAGPSSAQGTPAPAPAMKSSPAPPAAKIDKPATKKKGTAAPVKKPTKKTNVQAKPATGTTSTSNRASQTPGPTAAAGSDSESNDGGEYCICRGPDDHRMMMNCEGGCDDWYHCSCLKINEKDASELLDRFICPNCQTDTKYTTWKRMCRYNNVGRHLRDPNPCRKAARVTADPPSKYCSDEHLTAFMEFVKSLVRADDKPSMGGALNQEEVGQLLQACQTAEKFHALGKKPRLPVPEGRDPNLPIGLDYITEEEAQELSDIEKKKDSIQKEIDVYGRQKKLLEMVHFRAKMASDLCAKNTDLSDGVKDICGYDNRLSFNQVQFEKWYATIEGQKAFETGVLGPRTEETMYINRVIEAPGHVAPPPRKVLDALQNICLKQRKKCKHINWREIHNQDYLEMPTVLKMQLKKLEARAFEIVDDAETREATKDYYADNITIQLF